VEKGGRQLPIKSHKVAWVCGDFLEVIETREPIFCDTGQPVGMPERERKDKDTKKDAFFRAAYRAQRTARRLINTNHLYFMWTLTFAPDTVENEKYTCLANEEQKDRKKVFSVWKQFLRRVHRNLVPKEDFNWLMVLERHDSFKTHPIKKDTYHIHLATDSQVSTHAVQKTWKHGICNIQDFTKTPAGKKRKKIENPGAYISKYIAKEVNGYDRSEYQKRYTTSRGLRRPIKVNIPGQIALLSGYTRGVSYSAKKFVQGERGQVLVKISTTYKIDRRDHLEALLLKYFKEGGVIYGGA
jgi:hypothetical protein